MTSRAEILNDGPDRWVLVDIESDEPAPVYLTKEAAYEAAESAGLIPTREHR